MVWTLMCYISGLQMQSLLKIHTSPKLLISHQHMPRSPSSVHFWQAAYHATSILSYTQNNSARPFINYTLKAHLRKMFYCLYITYQVRPQRVAVSTGPSLKKNSGLNFNQTHLLIGIALEIVKKASLLISRFQIDSSQTRKAE